MAGCCAVCTCRCVCLRRADLAEAAHTEGTLRESIEHAKRSAADAADALQKELVATRRHWESRTTAAVNESRSLSAQLVEVQRELAMANHKWEASMQCAHARTHARTHAHASLRQRRGTCTDGTPGV
jgi:hypothetical protein